MAPVDIMGCERIPNQIHPNIETLNPQNFRFQLLISLMLSSQTKDEVTFNTMKDLNQFLYLKGFPQGLCVEGIQSLNQSQIDTIIGKVGFHNRKSGYIKNATDILVDRYNGDIPNTIEGIVELPGVGPKMGHLLLQKGWNINSGIGVDVHLHRLCQMWKWVPTSSNPETTRKALEQWIAPILWSDINPLLVGFGQVICTPREKNCDICELSKGLCHSVEKKKMKPMTEERRKKLLMSRGNLVALIDECM